VRHSYVNHSPYLAYGSAFPGDYPAAPAYRVEASVSRGSPETLHAPVAELQEDILRG